jgi:hypothetical protein
MVDKYKREEIDTILAMWGHLSDSEKEVTIAMLLDRTRTWHSWSFENASAVQWLEMNFAKAGIAFRSI